MNLGKKRAAEQGRAIELGVPPEFTSKFAGREKETGVMLHPRVVTWEERDTFFLSGAPIDSEDLPTILEDKPEWHVPPKRSSARRKRMVAEFARALWNHERCANMPTFSRACWVATMATVTLDFGFLVPVEWVTEAVGIDLFLEDPLSNMDLRPEPAQDIRELHASEVADFLDNARARTKPDFAPLFPWHEASEDGVSHEQRKLLLEPVLTRAMFGDEIVRGKNIQDP